MLQTLIKNPRTSAVLGACVVVAAVAVKPIVTRTLGLLSWFQDSKREIAHQVVVDQDEALTVGADLEVKTLIDPATPPTGPHGRKIGRILGSQIRRELGYPKYTAANRTVAAQRVEAARREHLPHLRQAHAEDFVEHALFYVFHPTIGEQRMWDRIHDGGAQFARGRALGKWEGRLPYIPIIVQRFLGTAVFRTMDFQ